MQAVKINQRVTHDGILIPIEKVKDFEDKDVEIIILPSDEQISAGKNTFMGFAGKLPAAEADEMTKKIEECRTIDEDTWR